MEAIVRNKLPEPFYNGMIKKRKYLYGAVSVVVFAAVAFLAEVKLNIHLGFNPHVFATFNAIINSIVATLLVAALFAVKV